MPRMAIIVHDSGSVLADPHNDVSSSIEESRLYFSLILLFQQCNYAVNLNKYNTIYFSKSMTDMTCVSIETDFNYLTRIYTQWWCTIVTILEE